MTLNQFRSLLYTVAKALGDLQAVQSKKPRAVEKRIWRRILGKFTGRLFG